MLEFAGNHAPLLFRLATASLLLMALTWAVVLLMWRRSPAFRHRVLCLGAGGSLLLVVVVPVTSNLSPTIRLVAQSEESLEEPGQSRITPDPIPYEPQVNALSMIENDPHMEGSVSSPTLAAGSNRLDDLTPSMVFVISDASSFEEVMPTAQAASTPARFVESLTAGQIVVVVWLLGMAYFALRFVIQHWLVAQILTSAVRVTDERTAAMLQSLADASNRHDVRLFCSESVQVPLAVGFLRPSVVLPIGYGKWPEARLRVVLAHEVTHIARRDLLAQLIARLACVVYWFNPLAHLTVRRMRIERELACDDALLVAGHQPSDYADHLLGIAHLIRRSWSVPQASSAMATHTNLRYRVGRILNPGMDRRDLSRRGSCWLLLTATMVSTLLALSSPSIATGPQESGNADPSAQLGTGASNVDAKTDLDQTEVTLSGDLSADWIKRLEQMPKLRRLTVEAPGANWRPSLLARLDQLESFHARNFPLQSPMANATLGHVARLPKMQSLRFETTGLTEQGLRSLGESDVTDLALIGEEQLTDAAYKHVGRMQSLERLELTSTPIEATGLRHLQNCPQLKSFTLLKDRAATKRLPVIAGFKSLEELTLSDTAYTDLVVLKQTKSLRTLTLRRCGAFQASESLGQLTQLKRLVLDNCDIRKESFADVREQLAALDIDVIDATRPAPRLLERQDIVTEATRLGRKVHHELDMASNHPTFWVEWGGSWGEIPTMQQEPIRTLHRLKKALEEKSEPLESAFDDQKSIMAWSPGEFYTNNRWFKDGKLASNTYKYGDAKIAWAREKYGEKHRLKHFPRNGMKEFADSLHYIPPQMKITIQDYWWGPGTHHRVTASPVFPSTAFYRELPSELFGGEDCRVIESPARSERLWISRQSGRLRGVLTYIHQGYFIPFYKQQVVADIVGREVKSREDYRTLLQDEAEQLTPEQKSQLTSAWAEYQFASAIPNSLYELSDYREIAPGKWFPFKVRRAGWLHNEENNQYYTFHNSESTVTSVFTDREDLRSLWQPLLPKEGESVQDQRFAAPVDYEYSKERTEEQIQALVHARLFRYAKSGILLDQRAAPLDKLIGKPALPLPDERWIGERPELKGKSYLLHCWATWCGPCKNDVPLLNQIAKNRPVIGIHPSGTAMSEIKESAEKSEMKYPTVVAAPGSDDIFGYPIKVFPYVIVVDEDGNVAKHGSLYKVLGPDADSAASDGSRRASIGGEILATKQEQGMAVLSLGVPEGIKKRDMVRVFRDGKPIGRLQVVLVQKNRSVGKLVGDDKQPILKEGDTIQLP